MTVQKLASLICRKEGKKVQVSIGNAREIVGILSDILYKESRRGSTYRNLIKAGYKRHVKARRKK